MTPSIGKVDKGVVTSQSRKAHYDYKISVRTGSLNEAGTSARIYVTLRGSKGDVKRRRLTRGGRREFTFAPGSLERFRIQGKDIGELKQITGMVICVNVLVPKRKLFLVM